MLTDRDLSGYETVTGAVTGTPAYMPPEQARGEVDAHSPASDVYSLGVMLYEVLCGEPPFLGRSAREIWQKVLTEEPFPVESRTALPLPEALVTICDRAMAHDPADRYPDAGALAEALGAWLMDLHHSPNEAELSVQVGRPATPAEAAEIVRSLSDPLWSHVLRGDHGRIFRLREGEYFCREGDQTGLACVLLKGELEIWRGERAVAIEDREGTFIGETAMLTESPRTATVRARTAAWIRLFDAASFERFASDHPAVAIRLIRDMATRLARNS